MQLENTLKYATYCDRQDPLRNYRNKFYYPHKKQRDPSTPIYFCGNSLGLQPRSVRRYIMLELDTWRQVGVKGHFEAPKPWYNYHEYLQPQTAKLVGAMPEETVVMNSLTVNLHLLMASFYRPTTQRYKIIMEAGAFSSDRYAVMTQVMWHGLNPADVIVEIAPREGEHCLLITDIKAAIAEHADSLALVLFSGVQYYTGQFFDIAAITYAAHRAGAIAGFDLAHAVGNVPLQLHEWNVDFAAWCGYKYLNSGPGGSSGVFVHEKHGNHPSKLPRLAGWWSMSDQHRFQMPQQFVAQKGAAGWQISNAQVLPMAAHLASLDLFDEVGMTQLREKSEQLTAFAEYVITEANKAVGGNPLRIITPKDPKQRGCQLSVLLLTDKGKRIFDYLQRNGVELDWRNPNVMRLAPVPFYNTFEEVYQFGQLLVAAIKSVS
jgi:kynureninase